MCAFLLAQFRRDTRSSYLFPFASLGSAVAFMLLVIWEAHPATQDWLKEAYTTALQVVGGGRNRYRISGGSWLASPP